MNPLTEFKKIRILPLLIALALVFPRAGVGCTAAGEHGCTVEQDRRGHGRGLRRVPGGGLHLYGVRVNRRLQRRRRDRGRVSSPRTRRSPRRREPQSIARSVEAAYRTLRYYFSSFPVLLANLDADYAEALSPSNLDGCTADGGAGTGCRPGGCQRGHLQPHHRSQPDGRMTPIGVTSPFPTLPPGPGVWRLTPPFAAPQTPWVGNVRRFVLQSVDQFLPDPPPSLQSDEWVEAFNEIKAYGAATSSVRTEEQTAIAKFWSANVIRQYNRVGRDIAAARGLSLLETARLAAMVNLVGADALMSALYAKYHYLFWRPVTAIDPTAVITDGFGPVPGYDDGNPATVEQTGWRPLLTTPNHPEYPCRARRRSRRRWPRSSAPSSAPTTSTSISTASTPPGRPGT